MKKLLALVLALVMTLSLCVTSNAAFTDAKNVDADFEEAVAVLSGMGVFKGYEDGSFKPEGNITRAEVAAIVYRLYTGDVKDKQAGLYAGYGKFDDMAGAQWAAGYVGFCANAGFVKGYGNGKFGPSDQVTGYQALAMILRAVGYGQNGEFEGADWELHVAQVAQQVGALKNVKDTSLKAAASRQLVAELLFQVAAKVNTVTYTPAFGYVTADIAKDVEADTLGKKNFDLFKLTGTKDDWGRPSHKWIADENENGKKESSETLYATIADKAVATYSVATSYCDICEDLGESKKAEIEAVYTNGVEDDEYNGVKELSATATSKKMGAQGQLVEVYDGMGEDEDQYRFVIVDTYVAVVADVDEGKTDKNGHVVEDAHVELCLYLDDGMCLYDLPLVEDDGGYAWFYLKGNDYEEDEYLLIAVNENEDNFVEFVGWDDEEPLVEVIDTVKPTTMELDGFDISLKSLISGGKPVTEVKLDGEWVKTAKNLYIGEIIYNFYNAAKTTTKNFGKVQVIFDQYENVIALLPVEVDETVVVIDEIYTETEKGKSVLKADLVGTDGEIETYTIDEVDVDGIVLDVEDFSDKASRNKETYDGSETGPNLYDTLFYYVEDSDDTFDLYWADAEPGHEAETDVSGKDRGIYFGYGDDGRDWAVYTDDTKFLIHENDGSYTAVTGDEVEDIKAMYIEVLYTDDYYADVVYLYGYIYRSSDVTKVYVPIQDIGTVEKQKIDGDYYTCVELDVIPAEGGKTESAYLVLDPEYYMPTGGPDYPEFDWTRIGGFFADVVYAKDTKVLDVFGMMEALEGPYGIFGDDNDFCYFYDVSGNTVCLYASDDEPTGLFFDYMFDWDDVWYYSVNAKNVDIYVIEDGEISKGDVKDLEGNFGFVFWDEDDEEWTALYVDLDMTDYLEDFYADFEEVTDAMYAADEAADDAAEALSAAQAAVDAAQAAVDAKKAYDEAVAELAANKTEGEAAVAALPEAWAAYMAAAVNCDHNCDHGFDEDSLGVTPIDVDLSDYVIDYDQGSHKHNAACKAAYAELITLLDEASYYWYLQEEVEEELEDLALALREEVSPADPTAAELEAAKAVTAVELEEALEAAVEVALDAGLADDAADEALSDAIDAVEAQRATLIMNPWLISFAL